MALIQLADHMRLVAHMSFGAEVWSNSIIVQDVTPGDLTGTESVVTNWHDFMRGNVQNNAFLESISGYHVFQHHEGDAEIDHPPIFTNVYHENGLHDTTYNGPPGGDSLPKDVCIFAKLSTSGGRSGKLFIRDVLDENDVTSVQAGLWSFVPGGSRFTTARFATHVAATIGDNLVGGSDAGNHLVVVGHLLNVKAGDARSAFSTPVSAITAIRPTWNKSRR